MSETFDQNTNVRAALLEQMRGIVETRCVRDQDPTAASATPFEWREEADGTGGTKLTFQGYASVVERGYDVWAPAVGDFTEVINRGAFDETLKRQPDVSFKLNHEGLPMAKTSAGDLTLSADDTGLYAEARLDTERADVKLMRQAIEAGHLNEMSFAFRVDRQTWSEDGTTRFIDAVNLSRGDVSVVEWGANPATAGLLSLRSKLTDAGITADKLAAAFRALTTFNEERAMDPECEATLRLVLSLTSIADTAVDEAQIALADILGVPNPDEAQDAVLEDSEESEEGTTTESDSRRSRLALVQLRAVAGRY